jgi:hypothetical protein
VYYKQGISCFVYAAKGPDQWLATKGLSTPIDFIASPLHCVVLRATRGLITPAVWALRVNPKRRHLTQVTAVPASLPLPLNRMPEGVDEYSDTKDTPGYVEKKKCRMVRDLNAACSLDHVGKQYDGNPEATKREQSESLHMAT